MATKWNMLKIHYDTKLAHFKQKKRFLPKVIYVDVIPNPVITAKDVYDLLKTYTLDDVFYIDDKIINNKVLLEKTMNKIQNYMCHTSARIYIINSPLLIYDLYHKMRPNERFRDEMHFEQIALFKVKAQQHFLIEVASENTITKGDDTGMQERINQIFSRFIHATLIKINKNHINWKMTLFRKLYVKIRT